MARTGFRPLLVTADEALLDDVLRLAAVAGTELQVATDPVAARPHYAHAPVVLIGPDQTVPLDRARLRRRAVVLVGRTAVADPPADLAARLGVEHIAVLPAAERWLVDRLGTPPPAPPGRVLAFIGARGGAGVSTLVVTLAVTAARSGKRVLLLDTDPIGGRLDLMLGRPQVDRPGPGELVLLGLDRTDPFGRTGPLGSLPAGAVVTGVDVGRRERDLVIVDLPRHLGEAGAAALRGADRTFVVVPAELRACLAASRVAALARPHSRRLSAVVRDASADTLTEDDVARTTLLPVAGSYRSDPMLRASLARGEVPSADGHGPLADLCRRLLAVPPGRGTEGTAA
ncbi:MULTISPECIES: nucleotide-binding protein [Catenuloplanes]|uniref:CO dehydrogenase nickel-insertion accessory protein CooC1 n=1 Tax=Catenuloplanes niger TaxID=587534 RepID=A0AAE3ZQH7_9ACTN|nr:septum site-determining protein minD [Catenuloplanes niger]MDR7323109.1 CO dehydrogenase nickel-insertion accessory protein CooC1 [Catenuloplanes niger]